MSGYQKPPRKKNVSGSGDYNVVDAVPFPEPPAGIPQATYVIKVLEPEMIEVNGAFVPVRRDAYGEIVYKLVRAVTVVGIDDYQAFTRMMKVHKPECRIEVEMKSDGLTSNMSGHDAKLRERLRR